MFIRVICWTLSILIFASMDAQAQEEKQSQLTGFVTIDIGAFGTSLSGYELGGVFTDQNVYFDDLYGGGAGLLYGGTIGIGKKDMGLFLVGKYGFWNESGEPYIETSSQYRIHSAELKWKQTFYSLGVRFYLIDGTQNNKYLLPFLGGGLAGTRAKESMKGVFESSNGSEPFDNSTEENGVGYYFELGSEFFLSPDISITGILDYSIIKFNHNKEMDGGGVYWGLSLSLFFGEELKPEN